MHKVVLEVPTEGDLLKTAEKLKVGYIKKKCGVLLIFRNFVR